MGWRDCCWDFLPFVAMVSAEFADVGLTTLSKAAMSRGMSPFVYVVYNNALGTLFLFPFYILQRNKHPPLTFPLLWRIFLLGLIGMCFGEILAFLGIRYSSPTLASTMGNLIPAYTFILAVIFGMEALDLRISSSQAKSLGTIISISGAFIVTLYKGPALHITRSHSDLPDYQFLLLSQSNWVIGGSILAFTSFLAALWNILQTSIMRMYPSEMTIIFFYSLFGSIQCAVFSLIAERDPNAWVLKPGLGLVSIVYSAIFGSIYRTMIHTWGLHKKGPVYVSMFRPLGIVIAVAMGVILLGDTLHIGSVIGAVVIALGFYAVMWGKAKEEKKVDNNGGSCSDSPTQRTPLLPGSVMDMNS